MHLDDFKTRTRTVQYDVMGRVKQTSIYTTEPAGGGVPRTFNYSYDVAAGSYTRTGPDNVETFVQLDGPNRVQYVERRKPNPPPSPATVLMTATYTYRANDLVESVTYANGASVHYWYDQGNRVTQIEHRNALSFAMLLMEYTYTLNDLPATIAEKDNLGGSWVTRAATTFTYDHRSRLIAEQRTGQSPYYRVYEYDAGGNRTKKKINPPWGQEVWYHYDVDADANPGLYGSKNNRLMYEELMNSGTLQVVSTTYYEYSADGNVTRVITEQPAPPAEEQFMAAGAPSLDASGIPVSPVAAGAPSLPGVGDGGGAEALLDGAAAMAAAPPTGPQYSAVRLGYAANGRTVTFAHGETWTGSSDCPSDYQIPWAREFRYDGARARYMSRKLSADLFTDLGTTWSDYDGDEAYGDFTVSTANPPVVSNTDAYEPSLWRKVGSASEYLHSDMLGTLRQTTGTTGTPGASRVFTAFGERMSGPTDRFGYLGEDGVQAGADFPFLLIDGRFYDPSSGAFLQRDVGGTPDSLNVYAFGGSGLIDLLPPLVLGSTNNPGGAAGNTPQGARVVIDTVRDMGKMAGDGAKSYQKYLQQKDKMSRARDLLRSLKEALRDASGKKNRERIAESIKEWGKDIKGHEKKMRQLWPDLPCGQ